MIGHDGRQIGFRDLELLFLVDQFQGFADQVHVVAQVRDEFSRYGIEALVGLDALQCACHQFVQTDCGLVGELLERHRVFDGLSRILDLDARDRVFGEDLLDSSRRCPKLFHFRSVGRAVEREGRRYDPDQDQHDQAHALLPVIRSVCKADASAGEDQQGSDPERRGRIAAGGFVEHPVANNRTHDEIEQCGGAKADDRRNQQCHADFLGLAPVNAAGRLTGRHQ